jgi:hypothetical protein
MPNNLSPFDRALQANQLQRCEYYLNLTVLAERQEEALQIDSKAFLIMCPENGVNSASCTGALMRRADYYGSQRWRGYLSECLSGPTIIERLVK